MYKSGFTLIELMVVTFILGVISLAALSPLANLTKSQKEYKNIAELNDNIQVVFSVLDKEIRTGSNATILSGGSGIQFINQEGATITYQRSGQNLLRNGRVIFGSDVANIQSLTFIRNGGDNNFPARVTLIITANTLDNRTTTSLQSTTLLRNR